MQPVRAPESYMNPIAVSCYNSYSIFIACGGRYIRLVRRGAARSRGLVLWFYMCSNNYNPVMLHFGSVCRCVAERC